MDRQLKTADPSIQNKSNYQEFFDYKFGIKTLSMA